jgi:hypothetical protein
MHALGTTAETAITIDASAAASAPVADHQLAPAARKPVRSKVGDTSSAQGGTKETSMSKDKSLKLAATGITTGNSEAGASRLATDSNGAAADAAAASEGAAMVPGIGAQLAARSMLCNR